MISIYDLRVGNIVSYSGSTLALTESLFAGILEGNLADIQPIQLTKEWFKKLGFTITDMADHWEFEKGDFSLFQLKMEILNREMPPFYILHSKTSQHIKVPYVHRLQNLYYEIKNHPLQIDKSFLR